LDVLSYMNTRVHKGVLALRDKYEGDLGLLNEPWADKSDRERFSSEQICTLYEYIEKLVLSSNIYYSKALRKSYEDRLYELQKHIDADVIKELDRRHAAGLL